MAKTPKEALESFTITSAAVIDDTTFAFCAQADETHANWKDGEDFPARLISHNTETGNWGWLGYDYFPYVHVAGGKNEAGYKLALFANHRGSVAAIRYKAAPNGPEDSIPRDTAGLGPTSGGMKFIGTRFYGVRSDMSVMRRNGPGDWERLHFEQDGKSLKAIDGYSETDIYVSGLHGALMHFDGTDWTRQDLPADAAEEDFWGMALVCAPDGTVYVGGKNGQLLAGSTSQRWDLLIAEDDTTVAEIQDLVWFKGTLYAMTFTAIFRFADGTWERAHFPDSAFQPIATGFLDANENVMLAAGPNGAAIFDGTNWTQIYGTYDDMNLLRLHLLETQVEDLQDIRDAARDVADTQ